MQSITKILFLTSILFVLALSKDDHTITVQGKSKTSITPDLALIRFSILRNSSDADKAWSQMVNVTGKAKAELELLKIQAKDISIDSLQLQEMYKSIYNDTTKMYESIKDGYQASNQISIKIRDINQVGNVLNGIVKIGVKQVDSLTFTLSDEVQAKLEKKLLKEAVQNAKQKAKEVLKLLDQKIVSVISVDLNEYYNAISPAPMYKMAMMDSESMGGNVFSTGDQEKSMQVTVTFEIANNRANI